LTFLLLLVVLFVALPLFALAAGVILLALFAAACVVLLIAAVRLTVALIFTHQQIHVHKRKA